jgi:23S rRNA (guanosine2251-2'-O)-methyltransferase
MKSEQVVFGVHAARALLGEHAHQVLRLLIARSDDAQTQALRELARAAGIETQRCERQVLDELTQGATHQGVVVYCRGFPEWDEVALQRHLDSLTEPALLLVLDGVQDPHNLGACLRTANAARVHAVITPKDRACGLTPTVVKVASGAVGSVPFARVVNLARCLRTLAERGIWIVGTGADAGQSLYGAQLGGALALVMGAEGRGLRRLTRDGCDALVNIPMPGDAGSLNVSVATGVVLFEALRQRSAN